MTGVLVVVDPTEPGAALLPTPDGGVLADPVGPRR